MPEILANTTFSTINMAAGIDHNTTAVTVTDGSQFPSTGSFRVAIDSELCICTNVTGNVLTLTRGVEDTTAQGHIDGTSVVLVLTAGALMTVLGGGGGGGSSAIVIPYTGLIVTSGNSFAAPQVETGDINVYQSPGANGDSVAGVFYAPAGTYGIHKMVWKASNMGVIQAYVDGVAASSVDMYQMDPGAWVTAYFDSVVLAEGHHKLEFRVTGKNSSSSGYYSLNSVAWLI